MKGEKKKETPDKTRQPRERKKVYHFHWIDQNFLLLSLHRFIVFYPSFLACGCSFFFSGSSCVCFLSTSGILPSRSYCFSHAFSSFGMIISLFQIHLGSQRRNVRLNAATSDTPWLIKVALYERERFKEARPFSFLSLSLSSFLFLPACPSFVSF